MLITLALISALGASAASPQPLRASAALDFRIVIPERLALDPGASTGASATRYPLSRTQHLEMVNGQPRQIVVLSSP